MAKHRLGSDTPDRQFVGDPNRGGTADSRRCALTSFEAHSRCCVPVATTGPSTNQANMRAAPKRTVMLSRRSVSLPVGPAYG